MIRGSWERDEEVKKVLESWGDEYIFFISSTKENCYYYVINGHLGWIEDTDPLLDYLNYEVVELPEPETETEPKFQPFQKVLVRDHYGDHWRCGIFSHMIEDEQYHFYCDNGLWKFCIPYEGNENLVGTTDSPKGGEE